MKFISSIFLWSIFVGSCNPAYFSNGISQNSSATLDQQYQGVSNANTESAFTLVNRIIEFEYTSIVKDSLADVVIMLTSGYNEGEIVAHMFIHLKDGTELKAVYINQSSRDYVESYSYNTAVPVSRTKTIMDPGGTDVVIQADGTHKHVHRAPSTKTVTVNETDTRTNAVQKSQIFNSGTMELNQEDIRAIKASGIDRFEILLENCEIDVSISASKNKAIIARL